MDDARPVEIQPRPAASRPAGGTDANDAGDAPEPGNPVEVVFRSDYTRLVGLARVLLDHQAEAEEVVQEAFARTIGARPAPAATKVGAYVQRTVVNLCRDGLRRRAVIRRVDLPVPDPVRPTEAVALGSAEQQRVIEAVRALPRRQRECVALRHLLGQLDHRDGRRARHRRGLGQDPPEPRHGRAGTATGGLAMIDELIHDALAAQIRTGRRRADGPGLGPDRRGRSARAARRRQRRTAGVLAAAVVVIAPSWPSGSARASPSSEKVATSPDHRNRRATHLRSPDRPAPGPVGGRAAVAGHQPATRVRRRSRWSTGGYWSGARTAGDGRDLVLTTSGCHDRFGAVVRTWATGCRSSWPWPTAPPAVPDERVAADPPPPAARRTPAGGWPVRRGGAGARRLDADGPPRCPPGCASRPKGSMPSRIPPRPVLPVRCR